MRDIKKANEYIHKAWVIIVSIAALYLLAHMVYPELKIPFIDETIGVFTEDSGIFNKR